MNHSPVKNRHVYVVILLITVDGFGEMTGTQFRTMTEEEVSTAVALAAREGWNPGLADAECFYAADPEGFFPGRHNSNDKEYCVDHHVDKFIV